MECKKREGYIGWEEYFMGIVFLAAKRSKDPHFQVGACIVNKENIIVGIGYNGLPIGCHDDDFPWGKHTECPLDDKHLYICHAEINAIVNKNSADVKDCTMYVSLFPCNECAKVIIQSGIKKVIYLSDEKGHKTSFIASRRMLETAKVDCCQYKPKLDKIEIIFSKQTEANKTCDD